MPDGNRYLIVANPVARRNAESILEVLREMSPAGSVFDVTHTAVDRLEPGSLSAQAQGSSAVIAVGGDGTVAEAATAIEGTELPIGIIPAGSTNVIARSFSIPKDVRQAARIVFERPTTRVLDVGICNGRRFLHMGGAGFDSKMFAATNQTLKRRLGWFAYLQGATKSIIAPSSYVTVNVDGTVLECSSPLVLVANGSSIVTPSFSVLPDIKYDDGILDVIVITSTRATEIARTIGRFVIRSLQNSPFALHLRGQSIMLSADPPIPVQLDGDVIGDTPASFSILPRAAELIVPW
jgi:YegS/Rv2252/BmrU family lipid kinase